MFSFDDNDDFDKPKEPSKKTQPVGSTNSSETMKLEGIIKDLYVEEPHPHYGYLENQDYVELQLPSQFRKEWEELETTNEISVMDDNFPSLDAGLGANSLIAVEKKKPLPWYLFLLQKIVHGLNRLRSIRLMLIVVFGSVLAVLGVVLVILLQVFSWETVNRMNEDLLLLDAEGKVQFIQSIVDSDVAVCNWFVSGINVTELSRLDRLDGLKSFHLHLERFENWSPNLVYVVLENETNVLGRINDGSENVYFTVGDDDDEIILYDLESDEFVARQSRGRQDEFVIGKEIPYSFDGFYQTNNNSRLSAIQFLSVRRNVYIFQSSEKIETYLADADSRKLFVFDNSHSVFFTDTKEDIERYARKNQTFWRSSGSLIAKKPFSTPSGHRYFLIVTESHTSYSYLPSMLLNTILISFSFALVLAGFQSLLATEIIMLPLHRIGKDMKRISEMKFTKESKSVVQFQEFKTLQTSLQNMKKGLKSFSKYVPVEVVRLIISEGKEAIPEVKSYELVISFADIENFTGLCEHMPATRMIYLLSIIMDTIAEVILEYEGVIDKFMGDGIMYMHGAPKPLVNGPLKAVLSSVIALRKLKSMNSVWKAFELEKPINVRIGMNYSPEIWVGNIGSSQRLNYSCIGDAVNVAARLEGVNKFFKTNLIISDLVYEQVKDDFICRPLDIVTLQGRKQPMFIYEVVETVRNTSDEKKELCYHFRIGFQYLLRNRYDLALDRFYKYLNRYPEDIAATTVIDKIKRFQNGEPFSLEELITSTTK